MAKVSWLFICLFVSSWPKVSCNKEWEKREQRAMPNTGSLSNCAGTECPEGTRKQADRERERERERDTVCDCAGD